jgi:hypothetical protein
MVRDSNQVVLGTNVIDVCLDQIVFDVKIVQWEVNMSINLIAFELKNKHLWQVPDIELLCGGLVFLALGAEPIVILRELFLLCV